jgi:CheY-like chemotaxis protein
MTYRDHLVDLNGPRSRSFRGLPRSSEVFRGGPSGWPWHRAAPRFIVVAVEGGRLTTMASPRRVLIVDDNVDLAENIAEILQIDGYLTEVAASGEEALKKALESSPDVVVTDYRLPGISGALFVEQFRRQRVAILAVVISAYTDEGTIKEARDAGATFMPKPVDFKLLSHWIREASA